MKIPYIQKTNYLEQEYWHGIVVMVVIFTSLYRIVCVIMNIPILHVDIAETVQASRHGWAITVKYK